MFTPRHDGPSGPPPRRRRAAARRLATAVLTVLLLPLASLAVLVAGASAAAAAPAASGTVDAVNGFPTWYEDAGGNRVEPCIDPGDPNCVLAPSATFNPADPVTFPGNYPDEAFYALADSNLIATAGCAGTAPGRASVRLALESAFATPDGGAAPGQQLVFGRIRVKVTSGLCPNTTYQFRHPFGVETLTTNAAGAIPANVGTQDIGCVAGGPLPCDFSKATASRVFGTAAGGGFLRWDPAVVPPAPGGYLGDGATPHAITGGNSGNAFEILTNTGTPLSLRTDQFVIAGKLAGSLTASAVDFGGQNVGTTSAAHTITVTNLDKASVTVGAPTLAGPAAAAFAITGGTCSGAVPARDATCTITTTFTPTTPGRQTASLVVPSTGGVRSPLSVPLSGNGTAVGAVADVGLAPATLAFPDTRVRVVSPIQNVTVTNTGTAPLRVSSVALDHASGTGADHYRIASNTCLTTTVDPGATCTVGVAFAPLTVGAHPTTLLLTANTAGSPHSVAVTGKGIGGVAAVSPTPSPADGFPDWYRDEAGVKVAQCIDPADARCVVLPDATFNPANPLVFPSNFPGEFFYQVATSNVMDTPGCLGSAPGRALFRSAVEGSFTGGEPVAGDQITFGRIRISVTSGLCPDTTYTVTSPYGADTFTTNAAGGIPRNAGTDDVGCFPVAPDLCDFSLALPSRVLGGLLKWDPAVAPPAPAGYLGDAVTPHKVVGAPFAPDGVTPANYVSITAPDGTEVARTDQFTVMGKLQGPLEATPGAVDFGVVPVGSTSAAQTVTFTNTGIAPIAVASSALGGPNAAEVAISGDTCAGATVAVGATCTVGVSFAPTATGVRSAALTLTHDGANSPITVPLTGTGGAAGGNAAISFVPTALAFGAQHVNTTSASQTVSISNAGGTNPLSVSAVALGGPAAGAYAIMGNTCIGTPVAPGASCAVEVAFTPTAAGAAPATLTVTDNAPGLTHTVAISGTGSAANPAVSPAVDSGNGFPQYYQDGTGTRVAPCINPADPTCVVLADANFNPANPVAFPTNFPGEFFYSLADSEQVATPGCGGTPAGTAMMRAAMEGSFLNGVPAAGDQITFGRIRVVVTSGLCPNTPYVFQTPYGPQQYTTNNVGGIPRNGGTAQVGCGAAPCSFGDALGSPVAGSFLRWDPVVAPAPPAARLGDPTVLHKIVGGTARDGAGRPVNAFSVSDLAGNVVGATDRFLVSGKVAGPLVSNVAAIDFGHQASGTTSGTRPVTVTNVSGAALPISTVTLTGPASGQFTLAPGGTCAGATVAPDATCTVVLAFAPTTSGVRTAALTVTPATGAALSVALTGTGDPALAPVASVTPGVLAYGTVVAGNSSTLSTTVRNTGNAPLVISGTAISGTAATDYTVTSPACGSIAPGATCAISVRFGPTAIGSRTGSLVISHNATGGSTTVSLTATGAGSTFTLSPSPIGLGTVNVNTTKSQSVSIKNSGTLAFTLGTATFSGAQAAAFGVTGPGCLGTALAPGKSCNITVTFRPTAATAYAADLTVRGDATSLPPNVVVRVTGTGK